MADASGYRGKLYILISSFIFALGYTSFKYSPLNYLEMGFLRAICSFFLSFLTARSKGTSLYGSADFVDKSLMRIICVAVSAIFINLSNKLISVSIFGVMSRMKVFIAVIFDSTLLGMPFDIRILVLIVCSIFGVTLVICPSIYGIGDSQGLEISGTFMEYMGLLSTFGFMVFDCLSIVALIKFAKSVPTVQNLFYSYALVCMISGILMTPSAPPESHDWTDYLYAIPTSLLF